MWLIGSLFCLAAIVGGVYSLTAAILVARASGPMLSKYTAKGALEARGAGGVSLVKPLHGAPEGLYETLRSFCEQDFTSEVQIVFGVQSAEDPAIDVVRRLQSAYPGHAIDLVIAPMLLGANRKVSNLIHCAAKAKHPVLILSDADIRVERDYIATVRDALAAPGVGAVTCHYIGEARGGLWARLSAMAVTYNFLPNAVLGKAIGMAKPCFGSTIALTRQTLTRIGGFESVVDQLADDYQIGARVRALGLAIAIPRRPVTHLCDEAGLTALIAHEIRGARTIRLLDPAGYLGSVITHPFALSLVGAALLGFSRPAVGLVAAILLLRIAAKTCIDAATDARAGALWLIPARDVLSFVVFLASFAGRTVDWQGRRYRVGRDGALLPLQGS